MVVAYGGIIREPLLSAPKHGWINLHFSALPQYRGAAPVQRAILAGDRETALTVFRLVEELDAGAIVASQEVELFATETADQTLWRLAELGAALLTSTVQQFAEGAVEFHEQTGEPSYAPKFAREEGFLDWTMPAEAVHNRFRAVTSEPGAYSIIDDTEVKIHDLRIADQADLGTDTPLRPGELFFTAKKLFIGTGTEALELHRVQPAGKQTMSASDWWRGRSSHGSR